MGVHRYEFIGTTNAIGGGTFSSVRPLSGEVLSVRHDASVWGGGTADIKVVRQAAGAGGGGTVLLADNVTGPWQYQPRDLVHTSTTGAAQGGTAIAPPPSDGYLDFVINGADASVAGTVSVFYRS